MNPLSKYLDSFRKSLLVLAGIACATPGVWASSASAVPVEWTTASGGNGHFYDYVGFRGNWADARANALSLSNNDQQGYLATLTSAAEENFLNSIFGSSQGWLGGSDLAVEGEWRWMDGPEAGRQFWQGGISGPSGLVPLGNLTGPDFYAPWASLEPNNAGDQDALFRVGHQYWEDTGVVGVGNAYFLEFNGVPIADDGGDAVPEPMTLSLLGAGLAGVGLARRRRG